MMLTSDATYISSRLAAIHRRACIVRFCEGVAGGLVIAALILLCAGSEFVWPACLGALTCGGVWMRWRAPNRSAVAVSVERLLPEARNVVVTAEELLRPGRALPPPAVLASILASARFQLEVVDMRRAVPARRVLVALGMALAAFSATTVSKISGSVISLNALVASAATSTVIVRVSPPAYLGRPEQIFTNPARLRVMRGSTLLMTLAGPRESVELRTAARVQILARGATGRFTAQVVADSDGFLSLRSRSKSDSSVAQLIPITVDIDSAPHVTISAPGKDALLPNGRQTIGIVLKATDDIGLRTLTLRFTRVSGSGERFTFTEGAVPLVLARRSRREWEGRAQWDLTPLKLEAGDMVVYRAIATDERPGATPVESDALIAEVASPGGVAAAGFALDPEQERYALSEQMVILKTERLLTAKSKMSSDSFANAAAEIAAEQRRVRAEFVFMMGGETEDAATVDDLSMTDLNEEAEAAGEDELAAGRMVNRGRVALLGSIRNMSRAAAALTAVDVATALTHERAALKQLEIAFSHSRIILRALADHERLDLTRRLGGVLTDVTTTRHPTATPMLAGDARAAIALVREVRLVLVSDPASRTALIDLSERALRLGPSNPYLQRTAQQWIAAAEAVRASQHQVSQRALDEGALALQRFIRDQTAISQAGSSADAAVLRGILRDAAPQSGVPRTRTPGRP
jgi:hypothetical protein